MIKREKYLNELRKLYDSEFIKVITGMRRVGKSTIMRQIIEELNEKGITDDRIIYINFEIIKYDYIRDYKKLYEYLGEKIVGNDKYYIFIDEIQYVSEFERVVNSINVEHNVSIFITGSNSNLLSGELATVLAGRYRLFEVRPFSFNEWLEATNQVADNETLIEYLIYGGLPQVALDNDDDQKIATLIDILTSITYKDIIARSKVSNYGLLEKLINYIIMNTSEILSVNSIIKYLKSIGENTKANTIYTYLSHIENSYIISECRKYDLKGKKLLSTMNKFYVNDLGLRRVTLNSEKIDYGKVVETSVYNHLRYLGYKVTFLRIGDLEIDFYATKVIGKGVKNKYIQVTHKMESDETIEREFRPFRKLTDGYDRIIVSLDDLDMSQEGVKHIHLKKFLLDEDL